MKNRIYAAHRGDYVAANQKQAGRTFFMKRLSTLAAGLLIGAAAFQFSGVASGQSDGWVTLLDSTKKGDWTEVGKANWEMKDGAIVDVAKVDPMPKAAGKWNTYEITAQGSHLVVVLNGQKTADVQDSKHNAGGPFALQYGSGVIKFRKVQIKPL